VKRWAVVLLAGVATPVLAHVPDAASAQPDGIALVASITATALLLYGLGLMRLWSHSHDRSALSWRAVALGIAMGISFACAGAHPSPSAAGIDGNADELDVEEAVFRYQLDHDPVSPKPRMSDFVLLSLADLHSPAPELIARFADQSPHLPA